MYPLRVDNNHVVYCQAVIQKLPAELEGVNKKLGVKNLSPFSVRRMLLIENERKTEFTNVQIRLYEHHLNFLMKHSTGQRWGKNWTESAESHSSETI